MSKELAYKLIKNMHVKLNKLIEDNHFDLLNVQVQNYSQRLDKVLIRYNHILNKRTSKLYKHTTNSVKT